MPTDTASVHASAKDVHSNLGGSISNRTSAPEKAKSSHMRMTSQDASERRQKDRDGLDDWTQMRRCSGAALAMCKLDCRRGWPTSSSLEPGGNAAMPTDFSTKLQSTFSQRRCHPEKRQSADRSEGILIGRIQSCQKKGGKERARRAKAESSFVVRRVKRRTMIQSLPNPHHGRA